MSAEKNINTPKYEHVLSFFRLDKYTFFLVFTILITSALLYLAVTLARTNAIFSNTIVYLQDEVYFAVDDLNFIEADTLSSSSSSVILWFFIGAIIYIVIWFIVVVIIDIYNDVLISRSFVHPTSFHQSSYWAAILGRFMFRFVTFLLLLTILFWTFNTFIPWTLLIIINSLDLSWQQLARSIVTVLGTSFLLMYGYTVVLRILFMRRRVLH